MAERIDDLIPAVGRRAIYPWPEWMDGTARRIRRGEDFVVSAESMAQHIRNTARSRGVDVYARLTADGEGVDFQFNPERQAA